MMNRKKLRYGGVSVVLTAFALAAVILLNVVFATLATANRWYIDMTSQSLYTLSDECRDLLNEAIDGYTDEDGNHVDGVNDKREDYNDENDLTEGDVGFVSPVEVNIWFCAAPDTLNGSTYMRYVYTTALELAESCDFINIGYLDPLYNPTGVSKYQAYGESIGEGSIIVESGTEYRTFSSYYSMFIQNDDGQYWAYNGEKKLASAILAVTKAESPVACVLTNHGETFYDEALIELLYDAGYTITTVDLAAPKNPLEAIEDARLVVVYNPQSDFLATSAINELDRLTTFLAGNKSLMVFMSPTAPVLKNFEEWLATNWGISFTRVSETDEGGRTSYYSCTVKEDSSHSMDGGAGYTNKAEYVTSGGVGSSIYSQLLENGYAAPVVFEDAMPITFTGSYPLSTYVDEEDHTKDFSYGSYYSNGISRGIYDVFLSSASAELWANGARVEGNSESAYSEGRLTYTYTDSDGAKYYLKSDAKKTVITDASGSALTADTDGCVTTVAGNKIRPTTGKTGIVFVSGTEGVVTVTFTDTNANVYTLSDNGESIMKSGIAVSENGFCTTQDGSKLELRRDSETGKNYIYVASTVKKTVSESSYKYMTITQQSTTVQETNYLTTTENTYVLACGSVEFATEEYLQNGSYGNADVLFAATSLMGREVVPTGIEFKPFGSLDISNITDAEATRYTLFLTITPALIVFIVGIVVLVRRKYS